MPLESVVLYINSKIKKEKRDELIYRVISRDLTGLVHCMCNGKSKIKDLGSILDEYDNPVPIPTEEEVIKRIEKVFKGKINK